jgi:hypothetical protein
MIVAFGILVFLATFAPGQTAVPRVNSKAELTNLITKWNAAEAEGNYRYIDTLLAKEFSFVGGMSRADYLDAAGGNDGILRIDLTQIDSTDVQIYGDAAIVTTLNSFKAKGNRPRFPSDKFWQTTFWVRGNGNWKCVKAVWTPFDTH